MKRLLTLCVDVFFVISSYVLSLYLRLGKVKMEQWLEYDAIVMVALTAVASLVVWIKLGLYRAVIRYMDVKVLSNLALGSAISGLSLLVISYILNVSLPRSIPFIYFTLILILTGGSRLFVRGLINSQMNNGSEKVIIYGAGSSGRQLCLSLMHGKEYNPVALIDQDPHLHNTTVADVKVYSPEKLKSIVDEQGIRKILLAIPSASAQQRKRIINSVESLKVRIMTIPGSVELIDGRASVSQLRDVDIKDLLGREQVPPRAELLEKCITGKSVIVTGGGGSIGSELCRQIARLGPKKLVIFEASEFNLYNIEQELAVIKNGTEVIPVLGSVLNKHHLNSIFKEFDIDTVYHASAYKHVPLVEMNTEQGIINNVIGTKNVAEVTENYNVGNFVLISTDKAVRPTNIMGVSKRLAELVVQSFASQSQSTVFSMVRFGNVLGSSGSVVPRFKMQIGQGGPVTVTHPEITRYFMTIPEAASLVIQAGAMAKGGEVFVLDMGKPVKIRDLAENMINLMGLDVKSESNPDGDIEIQYTGLRPGEKLYEELLIGNNVEETTHSRIMKAREVSLTGKDLDHLIATILDCLDKNDMARLREILMNARLGYSPVSDIADQLYLQCGRNNAAQPDDDNVHLLRS